MIWNTFRCDLRIRFFPQAARWLRALNDASWQEDLTAIRAKEAAKSAEAAGNWRMDLLVLR